MTLYELTKKYGEGKGPATMWDTVAVISEAIEHSMEDEPRAELLRKIYGRMTGGHYDEHFAGEALKDLYYLDRNGAKHIAPYWTAEVVKPIYESVKAEIPAYNFWDFYVTLNMVASDNWRLIDAWFPGITAQERDQKFVELALNWLKDPDDESKNKIWKYLNK